MNGRRDRYLAISLGFSVLLSSVAWSQTTSFTATYQGQGHGATTCDTAYTITGRNRRPPAHFQCFSTW
jgi:hypothetical protein